jgi:diguanylate cyclase (GGDEF)-like protein
LPVWCQLVALVMLPLTCAGGLAAVISVTRVDQARLAAKVQSDVTLVMRFDRAIEAVGGEGSFAVGALTAEQLHLTKAAEAEISGLSFATLDRETRAGTDRALAALDHLAPPQLAAVQAAGARIAEARTATVSAGMASTSLWTLYQQAIEELADPAQAIESELNAAINAAGHEGVLLGDMTEVTALGRVSQAAAEELPLLVGAWQPQNHSNAALLATLANVWATYTAASTGLGAQLHGDLAQRWQALYHSASVEAFDRAAREQVVDPNSTVGYKQEVALAQDGSLRETATAALLTAAVNTTAADAQAARHAADQRLWVTILLFLLVGLVTLALAGAAAAAIRRPLSRLAADARRVRDGELITVGVGGPREVRMVASVLSQMVTALERVQRQARHLVEDPQASPEQTLLEPIPGPLGEILQASIERIVDATSARQELERDLAYQAAHDILTDLPNRRTAEHVLTAALARRRDTSGVGVLYLDLDHFRRINEALGNAQGDEVLRLVADRLRAEVRAGDVVCRLGADEFAVVVAPVQSEATLIALAARLLEALAVPFDVGHQRTNVRGSVGISIALDDASTEELLNEAAAAMVRAKVAGGGRFELFDTDLRTELRRRADVEEALAEGLLREELRVFYQPVVHLGEAHPFAPDETDLAAGDRGRLDGFEALVRWERPGIGLVPPDEFIPVAEDSGLIIELGVWVLAQATRQLADWSVLDPSLARAHVAVNLSGSHVVQPRVIEDVRRALADSGLEPHRLVIELTETVVLDDPVVVDHLRALDRLGVRIALDDFGTGYTSIGQLMHLPVHILKIDRSFVSGDEELSGHERPNRIVELIVEVAHTLDLDVVAEGVESEAQANRLRRLGCEHAQGYLFSRPLPTAAVLEWVAGRNLRRALDVTGVTPAS